MSDSIEVARINAALCIVAHESKTGAPLDKVLVDEARDYLRRHFSAQDVEEENRRLTMLGVEPVKRDCAPICGNITPGRTLKREDALMCHQSLHHDGPCEFE